MEQDADTTNTHLAHNLDRDTRLVRRVALAVQRDLSLSEDIVELDDLVHFGWLGLLDARQRFDATRGTDFRRFAHPRIQGAIFDGLRSMTHLPRYAYQRLRAAELVTQDDTIQLGDGLDALLAGGRVFTQSGFLIFRSPYPTDPSPDSPSPEDLVHEKRRAERVREIVAELPEPDCTVARRHIFEGESLAGIAKDLGIRREWAWRIYERACRNIKLAMDDDANGT